MEVPLSSSSSSILPLNSSLDTPSHLCNPYSCPPSSSSLGDPSGAVMDEYAALMSTLLLHCVSAVTGDSESAPSLWNRQRLPSDILIDEEHDGEAGMTRLKWDRL